MLKHTMHGMHIRCVFNQEKCKPGIIEARPSPRAATAILMQSAEASLSQNDRPQGTHELGEWCALSPFTSISVTCGKGVPVSFGLCEPFEHPRLRYHKIIAPRLVSWLRGCDREPPFFLAGVERKEVQRRTQLLLDHHVFVR